MPIINPKVILALMKVDLKKNRDDLERELRECNKYLNERNDMGQTHRSDDPHETLSFTRGKSIGLVIAIDRINKVLEDYK